MAIKNGNQAMVVGNNSSSNMGQNANGVQIHFNTLNYSPNDPIEWDCRNAAKMRITYDFTKKAYQIKPICSFNGYYRTFKVDRGQLGFFNSGQLIKTAVPGSGDVAKCQWLLFRRFVYNNTVYYSIHLRDNVDFVLTKNENNLIISNIAFSGSIPVETQRFTVNDITAYNNGSYYDYDTLETYYRGLNWRWMLDETTPSSSWGWRKLTGRPYNFHHGLDIPSSRSLYSVANGTVKKTNFNSAMGEYVVIELGSRIYPGTSNCPKIKVVYQHLKENSTVVYEGQSISKGTVIGTAGHSGDSTGDHLHFTVTSNGGEYNTISFVGTLNPLMFFSNSAVTF